MAGHGAHADPANPFQKRVAITMSFYTVALAFANALANNANSKSIISANQAASRWSYFQSKSIKQSLKQIEVSVITRVAPAGANQNVDEQKADVARYDTEKTEIEREARELESSQKLFEHKAHTLEYGAIAFELAIIFAGVSLLQSSKGLVALSALVAVGGVGIVGFAMLPMH